MYNFKKLLSDTHIKNEAETLTSLRFIIALIVFLFHCKIHFGYKFGVKIIDNFLLNGAAFMTAFFVLSGYIMSYVYFKTDFRQKNEVFTFYLKRFARIYPVYIIATITYFIFVKPNIPYSGGDWLRIIVNDLFVTQAFFPSMFQLGINGGTWSISVEAFFYFLFPILLTFFRKKPDILLCIGLFLTLVITMNIYGENHSIRSQIKTFYSNPIMRVNEFMVGMAFYILGVQNSMSRLPNILKSSSVVFMLIFFLVGSKKSSGDYSYMGLHFVLIPLLGLLVFNVHHTSRGLIKNNQVINYLGRISYSFYMWQFIAIHLGIYIKKHSSTNSWLIMCIALLINLIISAVSYHLIEEKFRKIILNYLTLRKFKVGISNELSPLI